MQASVPVHVRSLILLLLLLLSSRAFAQSNVFYFPAPPVLTERSLNTLVYAVPDSAVMRVAYESYLRIRPDEAWLRMPVFVVPYGREDSVLDAAAPGHYLCVDADKNRVRLRVRHKAAFKAIIQDVDAYRLVSVHAPGNVLVKDAAVVCGRRAIPYHPGMQGYMLDRMQDGDLLTIRHAGDVQYFRCRSRSYENPNPRRPVDGASAVAAAQMKYNGYLVTNLPRYQPGDTVRWKVYAQYPYTNKPVTEALRLTFSSSDRYAYNRKTYTVNAQKSSDGPGVYFGEFVLGDTVAIDQTYTLEARGTSSQHFLTNDFRLADREPDELRLRVTREDVPVYQTGDSVLIYAYASNANGLPVMDGSASIVVVPEDYDAQPDTAAYMPDTLYTANVPLNPAGDTYLGFSSATFPNILRRARCRVRVANASGEAHDTSFTVVFTTRPAYLRAWQQGPQVVAKLIRHKQSVTGSGILSVTGMAYNSPDSAIRFPYTYTIAGREPRLLFKTPGDSVADPLYFSMGPDLVAVEEDFRQDTASFRVSNARLLPLRYALFVNRDCIGTGHILGQDTLIKVRSRKGLTVTMVLSYNWQGEGRTRRIHAYRMDRKMDIRLRKKDVVYPGQEDTLRIRLADVDGHGIGATNLTVLAFNAQLEEDFTPDIPYMGRLFPGYDQPDVAWNVDPLSLQYSDRTVDATRDWLARCGADTQFFYRNIFLLPYKLAVVQYPVEESDCRPQLAVFLKKGNDFIRPEMICIDGRPVYLRHANSTDPQALRAPEGLHAIAIRTADAQYVLNGVEICAGLKTNLYLQADSIGPLERVAFSGRHRDTARWANSLSAWTNYERRPDTLLAWERTLVGNTLLMVRNERAGGWPFLIRQGTFQASGATPAGQASSDYSYNNYGSSFLFGPMQLADSACFFQKYNTKLRFMPEANQSMAFRPGMMRVEAKDVRDFLRFRIDRPTLWPAHNALATLPGPFDSLLVSDEPPVAAYLPPSTDTARVRWIAAHPASKTDWDIESRIPTYGEPVTFPVKGAQRIKYLLLRRTDTVQHDTAWWNYTGYRSDRQYLPPGRYDAIVIWEDDSATREHRIVVRAGGLNIYPLSKAGAQPFDYAYEAKKIRLIRPLPGPDELVARRRYGFTNCTSGCGRIMGRVADEKQEGLVSASVVVTSGGINKGGTVTDYDGNYELPNVPAGRYEMTFSYQGRQSQFTDVIVYQNEGTVVNASIRSTQLMGVTITATARRPLVNVSSPGSVKTMTSEQFVQLPTLSPTDAASLGVGVYQSVNGQGMTIAGGRFSGTKYIVDGVQMNPGDASFTNLPFNTYGGAPFGGDEPVVAASLRRDNGDFMSAFLANMAAASGLRKNFRHWAIWQPNLWTDERGEVSFTARYPDNQTAWKTYVLAMNKNGFAGRAFSVTQAYKPLSAQLSAPRYLRYGDTAEVVGKVANYTKNPFLLRLGFRRDSTRVGDDSALVQNTRVAYQRIAAPAENMADTGALSLAFSIQTDNGYMDGEEKTLPVYGVGVQASKGVFAPMFSDTAFTVRVDTTLPYTGRSRIYADGSMLDLLLHDVEALKEYPYGCNEQMTTKLLAIYYEEEIKRLMGNTKLNNTATKKKLLEKLVMAQHRDGSFGWFAGNDADYRITNYIISTMMKINKDGWLNVVIRRGLDHLQGGLDGMSLDNRIATLATLSRAGRTAPYGMYLDRIDSTQKSRLSIYNKLAVVAIRQEQQLPYRAQLDSLLDAARRDRYGLHWAPGYGYDWYRGNISTNVLGWQILNRDSAYAGQAGQALQYLLFRRGDGNRLSTGESGLLLSALLPELLQKHDTASLRRKPRLLISGSITDTVRAFPATIALRKADPVLTFRKEGASPLFVTVVHDYFDTRPVKHDSIFTVSTALLQPGGDTATSLRQGSKAIIRVTVKCSEEAEYVMINVPIPAGCVQQEKNNAYRWSESSRQDFRDQTAIFCARLRPGTYTFDVSVEARFRGNYALSPARASLMYFPEAYGNEVVKRVEVK